MIDFIYKLELRKIITKSITYRNLKDVNSELFCQDIKSNFATLSHYTDMKEKIGQYNRIMLDTVNKHAPKKTKEVRIVAQAPWFDAEYAALRKQRRKAERRFRNTGLLVHKEEYIALRKQTTSLSLMKKKTFITDKLKADSSSKLFTLS